MASRYSSKDSNIETVKLLLENGANPKSINNKGLSILFLVSKHSNLETVKLLLDYGADPFEDIRCPTKECEELINRYRWKRLYDRDVKTAKTFSYQTKIPKEIWEIILLNRRRMQLCQNLSSEKNRELLKYFALEFEIPVTETMTKANLYGLISRYIVYGRGVKPFAKFESEKVNFRSKVREIALKVGLDPDESLEVLLNQLSKIL